MNRHNRLLTTLLLTAAFLLGMATAAHALTGTTRGLHLWTLAALVGSSLVAGRVLVADWRALGKPMMKDML